MAGDINSTRLRSERVKRGLSQTGLANLTHGPERISVSTIERIEAADGIYNAQPRTAQALANALGVSVSELR